MQFHRQSLAGQRLCAVILSHTARRESQKPGHRLAIFVASSDASSRGEFFEVADADLPEADSRRQVLPTRLFLLRLGGVLEL